MRTIPDIIVTEISAEQLIGLLELMAMLDQQSNFAVKSVRVAERVMLDDTNHLSKLDTIQLVGDCGGYSTFKWWQNGDGSGKWTCVEDP